MWIYAHVHDIVQSTFSPGFTENEIFFRAGGWPSLMNIYTIELGPNTHIERIIIMLTYL